MSTPNLFCLQKLSSLCLTGSSFDECYRDLVINLNLKQLRLNNFPMPSVIKVCKKEWKKLQVLEFKDMEHECESYNDDFEGDWDEAEHLDKEAKRRRELGWLIPINMPGLRSLYLTGAHVLEGFVECGAMPSLRHLELNVKMDAALSL